MKVVVFGSTGNTGIELLKQALERGHRVLAFARDPGQIALSSPRLETLRGDVLDRAAVANAVSGAEVAISVLGVRLGHPPGTVRSKGTENIVSALTSAKVPRFISVSTIGVGDSQQRLSSVARAFLPRIIGAERLREAQEQEAITVRSKLEWTILRPPRLLDRPGTGHYRLGTDLRTGMRTQLHRADLARALLDQMASSAFLRQCPSVIN
jgi:putative NADH-flavin reductase